MAGSVLDESVLVAGGTGFIGSWVAKELRNAGKRVVVAGRKDLDSALSSSYDAIVWSVGGPSQDISEQEEQHVLGPLRALASLRDGGQFVYLSSGQVYGAIPAPFTESSEAKPTTAYALAKLRGERCLSERAEIEGKVLTVLRVSLAYGPGQKGGMFVPSLLDHLMKGQPFATTAGEQLRDFIFVSDVAAVVLRALDSTVPGGLYNLGSGEGVLLKDVALAIVDAFDRRHGSESRELLRLGELAYRENEQMQYTLSMEKAKEELGISIQVPLLSGVDLLVADLCPTDMREPGRRK